MKNSSKAIEVPSANMLDFKCVHNIFVTIDLLMHQENKNNYSFAIYPEHMNLADDEFYLSVAMLFSTKGYKVALVDMDFQSNSLSKFLKCDQELGISEYIANDTVAVEDIVIETNSANLSFVPNGKSLNQAVNAFDLTKSFKLEEELKEHFDIIIKKSANTIDCPETSLVGKSSDGEILLVKENVTMKKRINEMVEGIHRGGRNLLGVVYFSK